MRAKKGAAKRIIGVLLVVVMTLALYHPINSVRAADFTAEVWTKGQATTLWDLKYNDPVSLEVRVNGADPESLTYQWKSQPAGSWGAWQDIEGATGRVYSIEHVTHSKMYMCTVSDGVNSVDTNFSVLYVSAPFSLSAKNGVSQLAVGLGERAVLEVCTDSQESLTYRWQLNNNTIEGATGNTYTTGEITSNCEYLVYATDNDGHSASVRFTIRVDNNLSARIKGADDNGIIRVKKGENCTLELLASATDMENLTYSWTQVVQQSGGMIDFFVIQGANGPSYTFNNVTEKISGHADVRDTYGNTVFTNFQILIDNELKASSDAEGNLSRVVEVERGKSVTLEPVVTALDTEGISYQWATGTYDEERQIIIWRDILGATEKSLTYTASGNAEIMCVVKDKYEGNATAIFSIRAVEPKPADNESDNVKAVQEEDIAEAIPDAGIGERETVTTAEGPIEIVKRAETKIEEVKAGENFEKEVSHTVKEVISDDSAKVSVEKVLEIDITTWFERIAGDTFEDDNHRTENITELAEGKKITISFKLDNYDEAVDYRVVRFHEEADGSITKTILNTKKLGDGWLSFESDRFSTFAVVSLATEMYRLYNPNSGEHFYTKEENERNTLIQIGWRDEGIGWTGPSTGKPVYRLYNRNAGDHHYTMDERERAVLIEIGWEDEGIGWYSANEEGGKPLYRLYNPNCTGAGAHHYTSDEHEKDVLIQAGWRDEDIAWYGYE